MSSNNSLILFFNIVCSFCYWSIFFERIARGVTDFLLATNSSLVWQTKIGQTPVSKNRGRAFAFLVRRRRIVFMKWCTSRCGFDEIGTRNPRHAEINGTAVDWSASRLYSDSLRAALCVRGICMRASMCGSATTGPIGPLDATGSPRDWYDIVRHNREGEINRDPDQTLLNSKHAEIRIGDIADLQPTLKLCVCKTVRVRCIRWYKERGCMYVLIWVWRGFPLSLLLTQKFEDNWRFKRWEKVL